MRVLIVTLMLLVIGLAGCAGDEPADSTNGDDTAAGNGDGGNQTAAPSTNGTTGGTSGSNGSHGNGTGGQNVTNAAPTINFTADVVNGTAPLVVNFTVTILDDSENMAWTFFVDGNETLAGTDFEATFNYTFEAGSWDVFIVATDGEHEVNQTLAIVAVDEEVPLVLESYSCKAHVGAALISLGTPVANVGGCSLVTISAPRIVHELKPGAECDIQVDTTGDGRSEGPAVVGTQYKAGDSFTAFCGPGAVDAVNEIVLSVPA